MGKSFNYREWVSQIDVKDTTKCLQEVRKLLANSELDDRQKMVALGFLVDKNKELYINDLKATIGSRNKEIELLKKSNAQTAQKKKIIIKKK